MLTSLQRDRAPMAIDAEQPLERLLRSVSEGWKVQPPVYYRRQWYAGQGDKIGYDVILTKADVRDLIVVAESERLKQFIELQRLKVIAA
jgi:hypothetical protein